MSERGAFTGRLSAFAKRYARLGLVVGFLLALWAVVHFSGLRSQLTLAFVHDQFEAHAVQGVLLFTLLFCLGNLVQIPGWIFLAAAVLALGRLHGALVTYAAACVSCAVTFGLIRGVGGDALRGLPGKLAQRLVGQLHAKPLRIMVLLRLLMQTAPALNYVLALSGVKARHYLLATVVGLPLPIALYCYFFDGVARLLHLRS